jgi:O-antigen/teichoic acid export membrane protein
MRLVSSVFYPVLSETIREHPERLSRIYYKIRHRIDALTMFAAGFLFATSATIIQIFYDERYQQADWMLQVLSLSLIGNGYLLSSQCLLAKGYAKLEAFQTLIQVSFFYISLPIAFRFYGLTGAIWIISLQVFVRAVVSMILMNKYLFLNIKKEFILLPIVFIGWLSGSLFDMLIKKILPSLTQFILKISSLGFYFSHQLLALPAHFQ